jgi:hypothetical protein
MEYNYGMDSWGYIMHPSTRTEYMHAMRALLKAVNEKLSNNQEEESSMKEEREEYETYSWVMDMCRGRYFFAEKQSPQLCAIIKTQMWDWPTALRSIETFGELKEKTKMCDASAMLRCIAEALTHDIEHFTNSIRAEAKKHSDNLLREKPSLLNTGVSEGALNFEKGIERHIAVKMIVEFEAEIAAVTEEIAKLSKARLAAQMAKRAVAELAAAHEFFEDDAAAAALDME